MLSLKNVNEGGRYIDLDKSYSEVKLMSLTQDSKNGNKLSIGWFNFPDKPTFIELSNFNGHLFPDLNWNFNKIEGRFKDLKNIYNSTFSTLEQKIYNSPLKKIYVEEVLNFYQTFDSVSLEESISMLKLSIAKGMLNYECQKTGDFIKITNFSLEYENKKRFLQAIADEIVSKSERIELLIQHSQTKGNYREHLVRSILQKYLPNKYSVATGFIEGCKRQCDILIYDSLNFSPFFCENDLVVVPLKAVRAVIEVKTTLDTNSLKEALDLLWEVARHNNEPAPIFKGIFGFKKGYESENSISKFLVNYFYT